MFQYTVQSGEDTPKLEGPAHSRQVHVQPSADIATTRGPPHPRACIGNANTQLQYDEEFVYPESFVIARSAPMCRMIHPFSSARLEALGFKDDPFFSSACL